MKIENVIARESVVVTLDDGSKVDLEKTPEELLFVLYKGETTNNLDRKELIKAFVTGCEKDMMKAFVQNYDFWLGRYESGYWDKETFDKRVGKRKDRPLGGVPMGTEMWEHIKKEA